MLSLLVACKPTEKPFAPEIRPVRVMTVAKTAGGDTVSLTGNIQAQTEVNLSFRIDGRMIKRNVDVGATVKPGQVIATLNADNEENALQSARANLAATRAQLVEARNNYERYKTLFAQRFVAEAEFDRHAARDCVAIC
jgi:membrane fusion protein, multidrug efflux system